VVRSPRSPEPPWSTDDTLRRFKLHLRPAHLPLIDGLDLPPLPAGKTVDDVFADFLGYIHAELEKYIAARYAKGAELWTKLFPSMEVVLTTPNGWELEQQQRMRHAAFRSGLLADTDGGRIRFVSEAEVCLSSAIDVNALAYFF
jgi:hypothetical protein